MLHRREALYDGTMFCDDPGIYGTRGLSRRAASFRLGCIVLVLDSVGFVDCLMSLSVAALKS